MSKFIASLENSSTSAKPEVDAYLPNKKQANGIGIVIFPGGGYGCLATHEGKGYAKHFQALGIACFVVKYRLANGINKHPDMLEDALATIETVRKNANKFNINRIGVMGSSAGGHLAAHTLVAYHKYESSVSLRPDFGVLCYPVICMQGEFCHIGSRSNLIGDSPSKELKNKLSCELHVNKNTPPCFIWHTSEDSVVPVENSILFASALRKNKVPFELHIYQKGEHGLGLTPRLPWDKDCIRWLGEILALSPSLYE